jgi:hypothetical protein
MSSSHNSSGSSSTSVPTSTTVANQISALGSTNPGWLNELQNLGYVPNAATMPLSPNGSASLAGNGTPAAQLVANAAAGGSSQSPLVANYQGGGNASLLDMLGVQYKPQGSST